MFAWCRIGINREREKKMKKIFSKLENKNEEKLPSISGNFTNFTGKQFQINKHTVVVEEILAEGTYRWRN